MPYPKLSALLNNCALHALTPEIKEQVLLFASVPSYDNQHNDQYGRLKNVFATFYGIEPTSLTWTAFSKILTKYNAFDTQILLGPVLRLFMKEEIRAHEQTEIRAMAQSVGVDEYIDNLTEIHPITARFSSLSPEDLSVYIGSKLGFNIEYHPQRGSVRTLEATNPVSTVTIFHQGGLDGAQSGGHWERTNQDNERSDYQRAGDTQLSHLSNLLGDETELTKAGLTCLKDHVKLTFDHLGNEHGNPLTIATAKQALTVEQILKYVKYIHAVPKKMAIALLTGKLHEYLASPYQNLDEFNNHLTAKALDFIREYEFYPVQEEDYIPTYMMANAVTRARIDQQRNAPGARDDHMEALLASLLNAEPSSALAAEAYPQATNSASLKEEKSKFFAQLRTLKEKADDLFKRKEAQAYNAATQLHKGLYDAGLAFFEGRTNCPTFKHTCDVLLKEHRPALEKNRDNKLIVANILLSLTGIYLIAAICNYTINGRFGFFPTDSAKKVDKVVESIKQIGPASTE